MDRLTIAIPTFNRAISLGQLMRSLQDHDLSNVRIVILNNASQDQTQQVITYYSSVFQDCKVRIVTHRINIGGDANFLRCFEHCETEWLWVLGDDDTPLHEAPQRILNEIDKNPECDYFNFRTDLLDIRVNRNKSFTATGISEFISRIDCYSNTLFISAGVYKALKFATSIEIGYRYIKAMSPQLAILISHLERYPAARYCFSAEKIIGWREPVHPHWQLESLRQVCHLPVELLSSPEDRWLLLKKIDAVNDLFTEISLRAVAPLERNSRSDLRELGARYAHYNLLTGRFDQIMRILAFTNYLANHSIVSTCLQSLVNLSKIYIPGVSWRISKVLDKNIAKLDVHNG